MAKRTEFTCAIADGSCGGEAGNPTEDQLIADAVKKATTTFVAELKKAGVKPVEAGAGGFDRGSCGHDRS